MIPFLCVQGQFASDMTRLQLKGRIVLSGGIEGMTVSVLALGATLSIPVASNGRAEKQNLIVSATQENEISFINLHWYCFILK